MTQDSIPEFESMQFFDYCDSGLKSAFWFIGKGGVFLIIPGGGDSDMMKLGDDYYIFYESGWHRIELSDFIFVDRSGRYDGER